MERPTPAVVELEPGLVPVEGSTEAPAPEVEPPDARHARIGLLLGLGGYGWWGLVTPLYIWGLRDSVTALELLAMRVIWGLPLLAMLLTVRRRWPALRPILASRRSLGLLFVTTGLIAINWFVFIYAVVENRTMEASLGYYINPLVSVALGMVVLHERLRPAQGAALALAFIGVAWRTISYGELPWISLLLAFSFGLYGLLRKQARADAVIGLSIEMAICFPLAVAYVALLAGRSEAAFGSSIGVSLMLVLAGLVTVVPLLLFTSAARRLRLTTMGFLQYLSPTGQLLLAVLVFDDELTVDAAIGFAFIWAALAFYSVDAARASRDRKAEPARA